MKLLTHNMLACHIKGVKNNYPFKIEAKKVEEREAEFNPEFLRHIFPRLEWTALKEAAETVCQPAKQTGRIGSAISRRRLCFANSLFSCRVFFMRSLYAWSSHAAPGKHMAFAAQRGQARSRDRGGCVHMDNCRGLMWRAVLFVCNSWGRSGCRTA
uniref:Multifunctional methyltransferase subunit TRM112-like protein n=1 Tax=Tetraselmis chuii TaxID=63592 RepID=A0A7S1SR84_9CHLO